MTPEITSPHNPRIKSAVRLRDRSERKSTGMFLIEGVREIRRALAAGIRFSEIFLLTEPPPGPAEEEVVALLRERNLPITTVAMDAFCRLAFGDRLDPLVAVAHQFDTSLQAASQRMASLSEPPLIVVVEGVEKPGNLGALLRTADAAGVSAVFTTGRGTDWFNPNTIRASLGGVFTVPVFTAPTEELIAWLQSHSLRIFAARVDAAREYTSASLREPCALVLGSEATGLSPVWSTELSTGIYLPMHGEIDSLNVSVTAAVLLYEARRQRSLPVKS